MENSVNTQATNTETQENNKLIAEFMEYDTTEGDKIISVITDNNLQVFNPTSNWNWLMPVVEKIESLGLNLPISIYWHSSIIGDDRVGKKPMLTTDTDNNTGLFFIGKDGSRIENTFTACIEFIKWYNLNNETP